MKALNINGDAEINLTHEFNAPIKMVFDAFSSAEALGEWWGPAECKNSVLKLDFRKGGMFHYKMEKDGKVSYGRFIFGEIQPYHLLEFTTSFADAAGNIVRAPFSIQLPLEIFYRLVFTEANAKTTITLTGRSVNAPIEESKALRSIDTDVRRGFGATFNKLSDYLSKKQ